MTQGELRENLKRYDFEGVTNEKLLAVRDTARDVQEKLHSICNELRNYNDLGVLYANPDEVRDCVKECLQAVADEEAMYGTFVKRLGDEIVKRLNK